MLKITKDSENLDLFNYWRIECPVCGKVNKFQTLKQNAYTEKERDTDFRPKKILWKNPVCQNLNPLLHFMACCESCFYTREFDKTFREWKKDQHFQKKLLPFIRKKHLKILRKKDNSIKKIGKAILPELYPFESAVLKFLLGIIDENLNPFAQNFNLARYYLRIAWLFREKSEKELDFEKKSEENLDEIFDSVLLSQKESQVKIKKLQTEVEFFLKQKKDTVKTKISKSFSKIEKKLNSLEKSLDYLKSLIQKENTQIFFECLCFEDFLFYLKMCWAEVPINEKEALELAFKYYQKSYNKNKALNQKIQVSYLLADISNRIGDLESAKRYFDLTMKLGQDFLERHRDDMIKTALAQKVLELSKSQYESLKTL